MFEHLNEESMASYRTAWRKEEQEYEAEARGLREGPSLKQAEIELCYAERDRQWDRRQRLTVLRRRIATDVTRCLTAIAVQRVLSHAMQRAEELLTVMKGEPGHSMVEILATMGRYLQDEAGDAYACACKEATNVSGAGFDSQLPQDVLRAARTYVTQELFPPSPSQSEPKPGINAPVGKHERSPVVKDNAHAPPSSRSGTKLMEDTGTDDRNH
ncbi:MAG: hypothetical protein PHW10_04315 [Candidatus Peribacteraceae bacterium]|nr:hypothetical protein [Candidatus Peribacteraceae bacterium]